MKIAHPGYCAKTVHYYDIKQILVLHLVIWVGNDVAHPKLLVILMMIFLATMLPNFF